MSSKKCTKCGGPLVPMTGVDFAQKIGDDTVHVALTQTCTKCKLVYLPDYKTTTFSPYSLEEYLATIKKAKEAWAPKYMSPLGDPKSSQMPWPSVVDGLNKEIMLALGETMPGTMIVGPETLTHNSTDKERMAQVKKLRPDWFPKWWQIFKRWRKRKFWRKSFHTKIKGQVYKPQDDRADSIEFALGGKVEVHKNNDGPIRGGPNMFRELWDGLCSPEFKRELMDEFTPEQTWICRHCGYVNFIANPEKRPICSRCGVEYR